MGKVTTIVAAAALLAAIGITATVQAEVFYAFDGDLVAYYSFDASNGALDAADDTGNGNDGMVTDATADCADTSGTALNSCSAVFDGDGDIVEAANEANFDLDTFTLAFWFNLQGTSSDNAFPRAVSKGNSTTADGSYSVQIRDSGGYRVTQRVIVGGIDLDTTDTPTYAIGEWTMLPPRSMRLRASAFFSSTASRWTATRPASRRALRTTWPIRSRSGPCRERPTIASSTARSTRCGSTTLS